MLTLLGRNATLALRPDDGIGDVDEVLVTELFAFIESLEDDRAWQEAAMLIGMKRATRATGFVPIELSEAPGIFSVATLEDNDRRKNARLWARTAFTWPGDGRSGNGAPLTAKQLELFDKGKTFYVQCGACHGEVGAGVAGLAPALADASWVIGPPERLARIILQGMTGPVEVNGTMFNGVMPPHGHITELDDEMLAGLMTYIRRSFGNSASPVSVETARKIRAASAQRKTPWTAEELMSVKVDRGYGRFVGDYSVSFVNFSVSEKADGLYFSVPMYGGGKLEPIDDTSFRAEAGGEKVEVEFIVENDGSVNKFILVRDGERIPVERKD